MLTVDNPVQEIRTLLTDPTPQGSRWEKVYNEVRDLCGQAFDGGSKEALKAFHKILFDLYKLNFVDPRDPRAANQFNPEVIRLRNLMEEQWTAHLKSKISHRLAAIPDTGDNFADWMLQEMEKNPSNEHPLYNYLATEGKVDDFKVFFQSEIIVNSMFEEFLAYSQLGAPANIKIELAKNYWDEMGNGKDHKVHTAMFDKLLRYFNLTEVDIDLIAEVNPIALAQGNLFLMSSINKKNFYQMMGVIGAGEYLVPKRYSKIVEGARRIGLDDDALEFYIEHISVDTSHAEDWLRNAIGPTLKANPELRVDVALGAYFRMHHIEAFSDTLYDKFTG